MDSIQSLPSLTPEQIRVLGALMEKSKTTPDYYPMTLNGLAAACNQKTSRKPVVHYDESTIVKALNELKIAGLISTATGGSIRNVKYKHNFAIVYPLVPAEVAVMCLLFLRGPLTPGEINAHSGRLYEFETLEEVQQLLEKLASAQPAYIRQLPRRPGQKEQRYIHLFSNEEWQENEDDEMSNGEYTHALNGNARANTSALEARLTQVEEELAELKGRFEQLMKELMG